MKRCFHLPTTVAWRDEPAGLDRSEIERVVLSAIARAVAQAGGADATVVRSSEADSPRARFQALRADRAEGTYRIPSYDRDGAPTDVPLRTAAQGPTRFGQDEVFEAESPFEGKLVAILPGWRAVHVRSDRYATSSNLVHAQAWGELLFGTRSFVVLESLRTHRLFTAATDETVSFAELRTRPVGEIDGHQIQTARGNFHWSPVLDDAEGRPHALRALVTVEGDPLFPPSFALARQYFTQYESDLTRGPGLDAGAVRHFLFDEIDRLIRDERTQEAADQLSLFDARAFALVSWERKARYLVVLVKAWTWQAQERAIVELFASMRSLSEVRAALDIVRENGRFGDLFADLDSELWRLLTRMGALDPRPLTVERLLHLLVEAQLIPGASTIASIADGHGGFTVGQAVLDEAETAARTFVSFVGDTVESVWMFLSHPEKVVEGVGQLVRLAIAAQLAQVGHRPSQRLLANTVRGAARQVAAALRGAEILGVADRVARRVKWAVIWEVASLFIGIGEVKAVLGSVRVSELSLLLARIGRILGLVSEAAEGTRTLRNLERVAAALAHARPALGSAEDALRLMSRLPEDDVRRLARLLGSVELEEGIDLARLAAAHPRVAEAAADVGTRSEALAVLARKAGGLTDEVAEAFGRISGAGLAPAELRALAESIPAGKGPQFLAAVRRMDAVLLAAERATVNDLLAAIARSPRAMEAVVDEGFVLVSALHRRLGRDTQRFEQYLSALDRIREGLPPGSRAAEYRRLLDGLERGDASALIRLESARRAAAGRRTLQGLEAAVAGDVRAERGLQRVLEGRHDRLLDEILEDMLPHDPRVAAETLARVGTLNEEQARGLSILHRISDQLPSGLTWGDAFLLGPAHRNELLELVARVHPSLDGTEGLAQLMGRALSGPGTNVQGTLGHLWAARTLQRRYPGARMRFEVPLPGREIDIRLTTGGRTIDVEVKTLLTPAPHPAQIRKDLLRHLDDRFADLIYLFEPNGASLHAVRDGMLDALAHPDLTAALHARGISPATAEQWLRQRLAGDLLGTFEIQ
jgi:hypothetical protein